MLRIIFLSLLVCHLGSAALFEKQYAFSATSHSSRLGAILHGDDFEDLTNKTLSEWHVPGVALALVDGQDIYAKGFGIATLPDVPVTPQTLFGAGSTTKSQTAAALSLLIDDKEKYSGLNWDTPISHVIRDDFILTDDWATQHLTFEDAMSHRTGMPRHDASYGGPNSTTQGDVTRSLRHLPLTREPRTVFQYCNMMWAVVGHVIETLTGSRLGDVFRDRIWHPLGMNNTFLYNNEAVEFVKSHPSVQIATPYVWIPGAKGDDAGLHSEEGAAGHYSADTLLNLDVITGAGAILSTAEDYAKYVRSMLHESGPFSKSTYQQLKTPRSIAAPTNPNASSSAFTGPALYSLGWRWQIYHGHEMWGHNGGSNYGADMKYFPQDDWAVVCLANTRGTSNTVCDILVGHIMEEHYGIKEEDRFDWVGNEKRKAAEFKQSIDLTAARYRLFPEVVRRHPPGPLVPLVRHEGVFSHPAYQLVNVTMRNQGAHGRQYLHVATSGHPFGPQLDLHHVSYEWFLMEEVLSYPDEEFEKHPQRYQYGDEGATESVSRATFKIGSGGQVTALGIEFEPLLVEKAAREGKAREEGMIWFDRV